MPYGADLLRALAQRLLREQAASLPDLSHCAILLPDASAAPRLRRLLLEAAAPHGASALLAPRITTLPGWLDRHLPENRPVPPACQRELMLLEALQGHPDLCGSGGPWALAESLLALFDELARREAGLPETAAALGSRLARGYRVGGRNEGCGTITQALSREATLVHRLWEAWQAQHDAEGLCEAWRSYRERLAAVPAHLPPAVHCYLVPGDDPAPAETAWMQRMIAQGQCTLFLQGDLTGRHATGDDPCRRILARLGATPGATQGATQGTPAELRTDVHRDAYTDFLDTALAPPLPDGAPDGDAPTAPACALTERARELARRHPVSPAAKRLFLYAAPDPERQARAVELQVRRWLLAGVKSIGIVTEDRRLARRVRALLERAEVALEDHGGWALSTTSAATAVERLLQAVEEDYAHEPLLDLLKSPFVLPDLEREERLRQVYRLEQDIILHENISRGLDRYRQHLAYRRRRLDWPAQAQAELDALLDRLETACTPLQRFAAGGRHPPGNLLDALAHALQVLGMDRGLAADPAGAQVLAEIHALGHAADRRGLRFSWTEFRIWLGRRLENATFRPPRPRHAPVRLLTLRQAGLHRCEALIVAAADERHLPGPLPATPFFNDAVRAELGLAPLRRQRHLARHHFRLLLESAPRILLTCHREEDGEDIQPAPWVALLDACHRLAYGTGLADDGLPALIEDPATLVIRDRAPLPAPRPPPRPPAPRDLLPARYSASRYQRLVDCPYLFFAADCLGLRAPERIREALEKSDYGARVHRILERFHDPAAGRDASLHRGDMTAAQRTLEALSREEFRRDLEDNIVHRGWLQRWLGLVPAYLAWQQQRHRTWRIEAVESEYRHELAPGLAIEGRLDRIERSGDGRLAVLDYKTGALPRPQEIETGEAVQLPFYALLLATAGTPATVSEVGYLALGKDEIKAGPALSGEVLQALAAALRARLHHLHRAVAAGAPLPAREDDKVCRHCPMAGLCRRQAWNTEPAHD